MKPTFALILSNERVGLLHRTGRGWMQVGEVAFDTPDLAEALAYLRKTALGLSPRGVSTKLVIPNSEILYCDIEAPGPDEDARRTQIRAGLAGRTPYAPEDLVFDWRGKGTMVKVAVVARQTLAEAEAFAVEHRFGPVSFVALPEPSQFKGEPFFGPTEASRTILAKDETIEPEREAMTIITRDLPLAELPPEPEGQPEKRADRKERPDGDPKPGAAREPQPAAIKDPPTASPAAGLSPAAPVPATGGAAASAMTPAANLRAPTEPAGASAAAPPAAVSRPIIDEAPFAEILDTGPASESLDAVALDDLPPAPSAAAQMAFASRRVPDEGLRDPAFENRAAMERSFGDLPGAARADPAARRPVPPPRADAQVTAPSIPGSKKRKAGASTPPPAVAAAAALLASSGSAVGKATKPLTRPGGTFGAKPLQKRGKPRYLGLIMTGLLLVILALIAAWSSFTLVQNETGSTAEDTAIAANDASAGANADIPAIDDEMIADQQDAAISSETDSAVLAPEATPGLRVAPAQVGMSAGPEPTAEADPSVRPGVQPAETAPAATAESVSARTGLPGPAPAAPRETDPAPAASSPATPAPAPASVAPPEIAAPAPAPAPAAPDLGLDATAAGPEPRPESRDADQPQDEILLATADTAPTFQDALKLPDPAFPADSLPAASPPPPPFGTVYQFDQAGLIRPTVAGILAPDGYMLFAGTPSVTPPERSAAAIAAALAPAAATPAPASSPDPANPAAGASLAAPAAILPAAPADTVQAAPADPSLAGFRPRPRPQDLDIPAAAESADDARLAPDADSRVALPRPRMRPDMQVAAGTAARNDTAAASLTAQANAAVEAALASAAETGNIMTLAVSRRPAARPPDMSRAVNAAVAAAVRVPEPRDSEPDGAGNDTALPDDDAEPELASAAPRIPTRTTVAKQATFANAINLSRINLIGVYGTPSRRHALIRLANGRYKKVSVGDNVDGGRVEAITASEVRYQKNGRLLALEMPRD